MAGKCRPMKPPVHRAGKRASARQTLSGLRSQSIRTDRHQPHPRTTNVAGLSPAFLATGTLHPASPLPKLREHKNDETRTREARCGWLRAPGVYRFFRSDGKEFLFVRLRGCRETCEEAHKHASPVLGSSDLPE